MPWKGRIVPPANTTVWQFFVRGRKRREGSRGVIVREVVFSVLAAIIRKSPPPGDALLEALL